MALHGQLFHIITSYILLIYFTESAIHQCVSTSTNCNCPNTVSTSQPCTLLCDNSDLCNKKTLNCRSGDSCSITCTNNAACVDAEINSNSATDLNITCNGANACKDIRIECGTGYCRLECNSESSCIDIDFIDTTNAHSFECIGFCSTSTNIPESFHPPYDPIFSPTPLPTPNPTIYPTKSPSIITINPTITTKYPTKYPSQNPSALPTISPTKYPTIYPSKNPSASPTNKPTKLLHVQVADDTSTATPTAPPTADRRVRSLVPTTFISATMDATVLAHKSHTFVLDSTCWIIIGICTTIVICVCCVAFGLVYLNHKHTQKMLHTYFANVNSTKFENKYENKPFHPQTHQHGYINPYNHQHGHGHGHGHGHENRSHQLRARSMILNPFQLPSIYDATQIGMNIHSSLNSNLHLTPDMHSINPQSYPQSHPSIIVNNNSNMFPNNNNMSPSNNNNNMSPSNNNNDAVSVHADEGTNTNVNIRKLSDMPALPEQIDDTVIINRKQSLSPQIQQRINHRHRTSFHMTPAGYMDEKFVSKKHKKSDDESVHYMSDAHSMKNTPNIHLNTPPNHVITNGAIELLKLGENHHKNDNHVSALTFAQIYNERKSMDVDDIDIQSETHKEIDAEIIEMKDDTDTDLSKELFASHSPSHHKLSPELKNKLIKNKSISKNKKLFYEYHSIGSLPVIISPNNKQYKNKINQNDQIRANSAIIAPQSTYESSPEPLQLPLLLSNNIIQPLKEYSESTHENDMDEYESKQNIIETENSISTYSSSHNDDTHSYNSEYNNTYYNDKYYKSPSNHSYNTRFTKNSQSFISDLDSLDDDFDDVEIKPTSPVSLPPPIHDNDDNNNSNNFESDEYADIERILNDKNINDNDSETGRSETSVNGNTMDDEIILYHANKLMNMLSDEDSNHSEHDKNDNNNNMEIKQGKVENVQNSISMVV